MDLIAATTRHLLLPIWSRWTGSRMLHHYRRFGETQFLPEERVREDQWLALQAMLRFAWANNAFYRARFDQLGLRPEDVRSFEDYARLPLLTKDDLRDRAGELLSRGIAPADLEPKRTGGSTGVPVRVHWDRRATEMKAALALRHDQWANFGIATKRAALWGDVQPRRTLRRKLTGALYVRTIALDTLQMDEARMLEFAERIRRTSTRLLFGHGHSLYHFARFLKEQGVRDLRLDGIISTAEMLPSEERRVIEEVFGKVVFDRYGCEEASIIASECEEHDGMHVAAEGVYVEVLGGAPDVPGRLVITDLLNRATPLLRYDIGDLATTRSGPCRCGRGLPRIGHVTGRTSDFLYRPDGRQISGISLLDTVTIHIPGFRQVQVVQERMDELTFSVVKDEAAFSEASLRMLAEGVAKHFGPAMKHTVVFVDKVPLTGRGKFQFSICKVERPEVR